MEKIQTLQERLEERALKKLINAVAQIPLNCCGNVATWGMQIQLQEGSHDIRGLMNKIQDVLVEGNKQQWIEREIEEFLGQVDQVASLSQQQ